MYRRQVIQSFDHTFSAEIPISFRYQFAGACCDLDDPELQQDVQKQMCASFETRRLDFPPNVIGLRIEHVSLFFQRKDGFTEPVEVQSLLFTERGTPWQWAEPLTSRWADQHPVTKSDSWQDMLGKTPIGEWELKLPHTDRVKQSFVDWQIEDILFVLAVNGTLPDWPA